MEDRGYRYDDGEGWDERRREDLSRPQPSSIQNYPDRFDGYAEGERFGTREFYTDPRYNKFPVQDDFQTLRQRYDEDY